MSEKKYPEKIYPRPSDYNGQKIMSITPKDLELAYDRGYRHGQQAQGDPLAGWSNLTAAIQAGERIDWEKLDGLEAKCVHPELGVLTHKLERNMRYRADKLSGWGKPGIPVGWMGAFVNAWDGEHGWSLYIKGEIPLRKLTADQLEPGTGFKGKCMGEVRDCLMYQEAPAYYEVDDEEGGPVAELKAVGVNLYPRESPEGASADPVNWLASQVEVLEVYGVGTFQTPKENQP